MAHLSHKLLWHYLDIDNIKSREYFSQIFVKTLEEFKSTSKDKPNYYIPGWHDTVDAVDTLNHTLNLSCW